MTRRSMLVLLLALSCASTVAAQQQLVIRGTVIGPDSAPLALDRVLLHRVDQSGGATIAETASATDGRFTLTAPASSDTSGIYFIAARYNGELYIGSMFKPQPNLPEQVLQVGVVENSASAMVADAGRPPAAMPAPPAESVNLLLILLPLLGAAAIALYMLMPRRRVPRERALLIRIAEIDERITDAPPGQRDALRTERIQLIGQLRAG